jgi:hypothetical protein
MTSFSYGYKNQPQHQRVKLVSHISLLLEIVVENIQHKMYYFNYFQAFSGINYIVTLLCNHHHHPSPDLFIW